MAVIAIKGQRITERVGAQWHLVGEVTRSRGYRNRLTLTRPVDFLSGDIRATGGTLLPAVQLTDTGGTSATLVGAQVVGSARVAGSNTTGSKSGGKGGSKHGGSSSDRNELERISFSFQKIEVNYKSNTSGSDDWTYPPG
jgi:hypothetical protein